MIMHVRQLFTDFYLIPRDKLKMQAGCISCRTVIPVSPDWIVLIRVDGAIVFAHMDCWRQDSQFVVDVTMTIEKLWARHYVN